VPDDVRDIRGTIVRGPDGKKLGKVDDVIFDHDPMEIRYVVVGSGGWSKDPTFLLPSDSVSADEDHDDGLATEGTRQQIDNAPRYDKKSLGSEELWKKFEQEFTKYGEEDPVMYIKGSDRIIVPPDAAVPAQASSGGQGNRESDAYEPTAADLFPQRISDVFSDLGPRPGKVTLRPKSVARAEGAAAGVTLLKPRWWDSFEEYLRLNKSDIARDVDHRGRNARWREQAFMGELRLRDY
jgi:sporulation protein YlmC with PRC-barrel domain